MSSATSEIIARRIEECDLATRVAWINDRDVGGRLAIEMPVSIANTRRWFTSICGNDSRRDFVFKCSGSQELVAMGGLTNIDLRNRNAELYVFVGPEFQGKGFGAKATTWLCQFAFDALALRRVYLWTYADNTRAIRMYERIGFEVEGRLRCHRMREGALVDRIVLGLLRRPDEFGSSIPEGA